MTYSTSLKTASTILLLVGTLCGLPHMAAAQSNDDVSVNLEALGLSPTLPGGSEPRLILKYPGSDTATRQVPQLRYPTVPEPTARPTPPTAPPKPAATVSAPAKPEAPVTAAAPTASPDTQPTPAAPRPLARAAASPAPAPTPPAPVDEPDTAPQSASAPVEITSAPAEPAPVSNTAPPSTDPRQEVAALTPPPEQTALPDPAPAILRVMFNPDAVAIGNSARRELDAIGESLRYDPRRIELKAYGGTPGDKQSDARRLSLKRGLAVRAYLIGLGIDSRRIDVRALGGVTDTGASDRVDVAYSGT